MNMFPSKTSDFERLPGKKEVLKTHNRPSSELVNGRTKPFVKSLKKYIN